MAATIATTDAAIAAAEARAAADANAPASTAPPQYAGLATRALGLIVDALLIQVVALFVSLGTIVVLGILHLPHNVEKLIGLIGGVVYVLWCIGYFVAFWSGTGQTPGARVMQVRVTAADGGRVKPRRAFLRCIGLLLAALPLFAGYATILFDSRRRGFQDWLARTVVVQEAQSSIAAGRMRPARKAPADAPRS